VQAVQATVVVAVAWLLGWRPALGPSGVLLAGGALLLATAAFCGVGLALAGRLRAVATLALANALFVVLLLISGIVFPLAALPAALATLSTLLPPAALTEVLRAAFAGTASRADAVVVLTVWGVAAPLIATLVFRWE
ncbi:MAG: ABC transporter permease, partial [Actinomycetota bacterium]|nr:ABC transporter permease [Actinomycetota bacterium]